MRHAKAQQQVPNLAGQASKALKASCLLLSASSLASNSFLVQPMGCQIKSSCYGSSCSPLEQGRKSLKWGTAAAITSINTNRSPKSRSSNPADYSRADKPQGASSSDKPQDYGSSDKPQRYSSSDKPQGYSSSYKPCLLLEDILQDGVFVLLIMHDAAPGQDA